jgi:hypothetical protein
MKLRRPSIGYWLFDLLKFLSLEFLSTAGSCLGRFIVKAELGFALFG